MIVATNRALQVARKMSFQERQQVMYLFDESPDSTDWLRYCSWPCPATEVYLALELMAERGY